MLQTKRIAGAFMLGVATLLVMPAHAKDNPTDEQLRAWKSVTSDARQSKASKSSNEDQKPRREDRRETRRDDSQKPKPVLREESDRSDRARDGDRRRDRERVTEERRAPESRFDDDRRSRSRDDRDWQRGGTRVDYRHDHRHDWPRYRGPRVGVVVNTLPWGYREIRHHRHSYFFADGFWFEPWGSSYVRIGAPVGVVVSTLPFGYVSLSLGNTLYYRYADTWYRPHDLGYVVVERPANAPASDEGDDDASDETLFAYPNRDQSEAQQAEDRFECHSWAVEQTGYDPSRVSAAGATPEALRKRPDYLRAMTACLEGRGYTVR